MITDTLNLRDLNEVGYLALVSALVLLGGLLGGLCNATLEIVRIDEEHHRDGGHGRGKPQGRELPGEDEIGRASCRERV